jgi:hypothetical protein
MAAIVVATMKMLKLPRAPWGFSGTTNVFVVVALVVQVHVVHWEVGVIEEHKEEPCEEDCDCWLFLGVVVVVAVV